MTTISLLTRHPHAMFAIRRLCLRPRVDHLLRHCSPSDIAPLIDRFDSGLIAYATQTMNQPAHLHHDPLIRTRFGLPARLGGLGYSPTALLMHAAFCGALSSSAPRLIARKTAEGLLLSGGFLDQHLSNIFGAGSFDVGSESTRFTFLLNGDTRLREEMRSSWRTLQGHAHGALRAASATTVPGPIALDAGPLAVPAAACGTLAPELGAATVIPNLQRDVSQQLFDLTARGLAAHLNARPAVDPTRASFVVADRFSSQFLSSHAGFGLPLTPREFQACCAAYLGLPPPFLAGLTLRIGNQTIDPHGHLLLTHPSLVNRDNNRANWHNDLVAHLVARSREAERAGAPETSWRGLGAGDAADLVCESLLPDDVALVCLATRSRGAVGELLLGSVADAVVRRSPVPVLLVGPDVEPIERYRRLVVALDGSELAERAGAVAVELADRTATDVALLEVIADEPVPADVAETAYLARYAAGLPDPPGRYDVVRSDRPGQAILDATAGADDVVVVMGTHGRTALRRLVMGSVAHHVVQRATAPVLVVPPTTTG